jgi:peptidylprolyl isomerase
MPQVKTGDTVKVHYTGKLNDGTVFDSSRDREPLEFKVGKAEVLPGFESAVIGMNTGEQKTIQILAADAYGEYAKDRLVKIRRNQVPEGLDLKVGVPLQMNQSDGQPVVMTVAELEADSVTLDANHPLAGKDLTFEVELLEVA